MMVPGFIYLFFNNYIPIAGLTIAFKNIDFRKGILKSDWIGFRNFEYLFKTKDALIITRNTLLYNAAFILLGIVFGVIAALLMNEVSNKRLLKIYQTAILSPQLVSWIVVSYFVYALLSIDKGMVNNRILPLLGIKEISWYTEPKYWPFILTIMQIWKSIGFNSIIYLATIVGIDTEYYEAATLDGASRNQQIIHITLPLLVPTIITLFLIHVGRIFYADFGLFFQVPMNSGALFSTTNVIDTYVYRALLQIGDIGMSAAAGFYQSIVGFALILVSNLIIRKFNKENALF
ncbi:MAG TPA: sugar ABC transporter permease [Ruminiclostridium sp.]|jgi:putative aldouronate transport system permease protein|nr:sugar ABC transporter permease [Ruminiclostridium sp.]